MYDETTYQLNGIMKYISYGILALGYLTFILGMYSSKLVVT